MARNSFRRDTPARLDSPYRPRGRGRALVSMLESCDIEVSDDEFEDAEDDVEEETKN